MLSPFECLCGNFILPEPASYVFFYAIFNLRKLLYIIPVVVIKRILTVDGYNSTFSPPIKRAANGVWRWPSACGNCRWPFSASGIWPTSSAPSWSTCKSAPRTGPSDASYMNLYREDRPRSALPFCGKHSLLRRTKALMCSAFPHKKSVFPNV